MSKKVNLNWLVFVAILIVSSIVVAVSVYYVDLPDRLSQHETIVLGQNRWAPGSQASLRVVVRDSRDASALAGAEVFVSMQPAAGGRQREVYRGVTSAQGDAVISFPVPEDAEVDQVLRIETRSRLGSDTIERSVSLARDYRVLLTTDKPLYQPGQVIHVRALALSTFDLTPAPSQELEFIIADGKGNKVFRQKAETSQFGVAYTDFQLANEVNTGAYKITATLGGTSSEVTVNVEHYVLPKFSIELETEKP